MKNTRYKRHTILAEWLIKNKLSHTDITGDLLEKCKNWKYTQWKEIINYIKKNYKNTIWNKLVKYKETHFIKKNTDIIMEIKDKKQSDLGQFIFQGVIVYIKKFVVYLRKRDKDIDLTTIKHIDKETFEYVHPVKFLKSIKITMQKSKTKKNKAEGRNKTRKI